MGRLVRTHSTYIDGLIKVLVELAKNVKISTVTPGVIYRVRSNADRLTIKITREILGGYKLIARKGRSAQEVFVITKCKRIDLDDIINKYI